MENKHKLNVLTISDKILLIQLVEKGDRKKCEITNKFSVFHQIHYCQLLNRKIKFLSSIEAI